MSDPEATTPTSIGPDAAADTRPFDRRFRIFVQIALLGLYFVIYHKAVTFFHVRLGALTDDTTPIYGGRRRYAGLREKLLAAGWAMLPIAIFVGVAALLRRLILAPRHRPIVAIALLLSATIAINLTVGLAVQEHWAGLVGALDNPSSHYYGDVPRITSVGQFLGDYARILPTLSLHGSTHPPGGAIYYYTVTRLVGENVSAVFALTLVVTALSVVPLYLVSLDLLGHRGAIIAGALYIATPNLVLIGPSPDGVFAVFSLAAICCFHFALRRHWALGALAGLLLAPGMLMTYSTTVTGLLLLIYAILFAISRRSIQPIIGPLLACGIVFVAALVALWLATGFNIIEALRAAMDKDARQMGKQHQTFLIWLNVSFGNLFAFLIGVGLVNVVLWWRALTRLARDTCKAHPAAPLIVATTATILLISFAKLFTLETERIWVFLSPLVVLAGAAAIDHTPDPRQQSRLAIFCAALLLAQTLLMQLVLRTNVA